MSGDGGDSGGIGGENGGRDGGGIRGEDGGRDGGGIRDGASGDRSGTDHGHEAARELLRCQRAAEERVAELCGLINAAHGELLGVVAEVIESGGWSGHGIRSVEHWLTLHCGVSATTARRLVTVARGLSERPVTRQMVEDGRLSVDQVAPICRDTPPTFEAEVAALAVHATVGQISRVCARYVFPEPDDADSTEDGDEVDADDPTSQPGRRVGFGCDGDEWRLSARFPALEGAQHEKALVAARDKLFAAGRSEVTWADAFAELCRAYLGGESVAMAERYQVVVHLPAERLDRARLHLGPRLPEHVADRLLCDTSLRALIDAGGRPVGLSRTAQTTPPWLRTLVEDRDGACRVPGCERTRWLEIHHVVPRVDDGPTEPDNLIALCSTHHDAHHRGDLLIGGTATELSVTNRHGVSVEHRRPAAPMGPPLRAGPELGVEGAYVPPTGERLQTKWVDFGPMATPSPRSAPPAPSGRPRPPRPPRPA